MSLKGCGNPPPPTPHHTHLPLLPFPPPPQLSPRHKNAFWRSKLCEQKTGCITVTATVGFLRRGLQLKYTVFCLFFQPVHTKCLDNIFFVWKLYSNLNANLLDSVNFIKQIMLTFIPAKLDPGCNTSKPYSLQLYIYNQSCRRVNDTASRDYYFLFFSTYLWNQWDLVIQKNFLQRDKLQYNVLRVIFIIYY